MVSHRDFRHICMTMCIDTLFSICIPMDVFIFHSRHSVILPTYFNLDISFSPCILEIDNENLGLGFELITNKISTSLS